jgi:hypothetical protein
MDKLKLELLRRHENILVEKFPKLGIMLWSQGLVVGHYQGWALNLGYDLGYGEGLADTGSTQQHLVLVSLVDAIDELADSTSWPRVIWNGAFWLKSLWENKNAIL